MRLRPRLSLTAPPALDIPKADRDLPQLNCCSSQRKRCWFSAPYRWVPRLSRALLPPLFGKLGINHWQVRLRLAAPLPVFVSGAVGMRHAEGLPVV